MKRIPLTQGKVALVSDRDYPVVRHFSWFAQSNNGGNWYAGTRHSGKTILLHRLLTGFPPFKLDHKNRNGLDNRRCNLRPATSSQNSANSARRADNTSGFK